MASMAGAVSAMSPSSPCPSALRQVFSQNAKRRPACACATDRASFGQLVVSSLVGAAGLALAIALLEAGHPATTVENLLLARIERVALRADLDVNLSALLGAARGARVTAAAVHGRLAVVRVNARFHGVLFIRWPPGRPCLTWSFRA